MPTVGQAKSISEFLAAGRGGRGPPTPLSGGWTERRLEARPSHLAAPAAYDRGLHVENLAQDLVVVWTTLAWPRKAKTTLFVYGPTVAPRNTSPKGSQKNKWKTIPIVNHCF